MPHDWLMHSLYELKVYASEHNLPELSAQLQTAIDLALIETACSCPAQDETAEKGSGPDSGPAPRSR